MLSIGKLAAGQAKYYLDQAEVRVDAVGSIGDGLEEYYAGGAEARGRWLGVGAAALGLDGAVDGTALRRVLSGVAPVDGAPLRSGPGAVRVAGFDLTFSAPKSVSIAFGLGQPELRAAVRAAHDRAVSEALGYLERAAACVRRGSGGVDVLPAGGLLAAAFRHRTSRAGDPQLHTHVLVANLGRGPDGRWSALDGRQLYAHARAASFLYQAVLRSELTRTLGVEWLPTTRGIAELAGVPKPVMRAFSRRRAEIEAALAEHATSGPRAAEAAALATRQAKGKDVTAVELMAGWRSRAAELGFAPEQLERLLGRVRTPELSVAEREKVFDELAAATGLTWRASTFTSRDVVQALCERLPTAAPIDAQTVEIATELFLASGRAVALVPDAEAFRLRDGRVLRVSSRDLRYSTPELLATEQRLIERVLASRGAGAVVTAERHVADSVAQRPSLSAEQREMVERLCRDGDGVAVVVGKAGTGKMFALGAARAAWQAAGYPVLGVAVARRAARELEQGAGIASTSVTALQGDLITRGRAALPPSCVLVVDEAGMVATRKLAQLVDAVGSVGGKVVLVGDHRQLPELEAGGAFRGLINRGLAIELTENHRQVHGWERVALDHLREGRSELALALYEQHDRIAVEDTPSQARDRLVADWWRAGDPTQAVMIASRRAEVEDLNARARDQLREAGGLGGTALELPGGWFAAGDHVVVKRNDPRLGILNGDRARVLTVDPATRSLTLDVAGEEVRLDSRFLDERTEHGDPTLQHGYAITAHIAQGVTVDRAFVLVGDGVTRESTYVALSRGRHSNHLYLARDQDHAREEFAPSDPHRRDPVACLAAALATSSAQALAVDEPGLRLKPPLADEIVAAEDAYRRTVARRQALETSRTRWLPGRRGELAELRNAELLAARSVKDLRRAQLELTHGARPFVTERELEATAAERTGRMQERLIHRQHARDASRDLGLGR